jgi:hypothetical protein
LRHAKGKSKRDFVCVYKGAGKSLKVNGIFRPSDGAGGVVYNEVPSTPSLPSLGQIFKPSPHLPTWNMSGIIPPQDFPNGISWPPKKTPENCYVEVSPPKLPPPQKLDCETILDVCKKSVKAGAKSYLSKFIGYGMCMTSCLTCKKVIGGGRE